MARSSLGTINPSTTSGTALAAALSARDAAENTQHSGSGRPSYAETGLLYADSSFSPDHIFLAGVAGDGSDDIDLTLAFSPRPGTLRSTAEVRLPSGWLWADGSAVLRASFPALLEAIAPSFTGNVANGSATVSSVSEDLRTLGLIGAKVEGTGITAGTTITAVTSSTLTLSANGTATNTAVTIRAFPCGVGNGSTTFNLPLAKDKVIIGRGDMGGTPAGLVTTAVSGFDGTKLAATGGVQAVVLVVANLPVHSHSASTSGTTDTHAGHTHGPGSYSTDNSGTHTHNYARFRNNTFPGSTHIAPTAQSAGGVDFWEDLAVASTAGGNHNHAVNAGASATGGSHSHVLTISTSIGNTGSDTAHPNVQPSVVFNVVVKT